MDEKGKQTRACGNKTYELRKTESRKNEKRKLNERNKITKRKAKRIMGINKRKSDEEAKIGGRRQFSEAWKIMREVIADDENKLRKK